MVPKCRDRSIDCVDRLRVAFEASAWEHAPPRTGEPLKPYVVERFTADIVDQVAHRYGLEASDLVDLGGFESFVYETVLDGQPVIIKVAHSDRRTTEMLNGEAEFTRYLAENGVSVASTLQSPRGALIESVEDAHGGYFHAGAWTKAIGKTPDRQCTDLDFWRAHGQLLGRMHALSAGFTASDPKMTRPHWDSPVLLEDSMFIPESDAAANAEMQRLLAAMRELPRTPDVYGIVHLDAHGGNVHFDGITVTLFDFDDCGFTWFADDLAIVMYYGLLPFDDPVAAAELIWPVFIGAYQEEFRIEVSWFELFPMFHSWRDHLLYSIIHRSLLDDEGFDVSGWTDRFHARQSTGRPIIDFDFTRAIDS